MTEQASLVVIRAVVRRRVLVAVSIIVLAVFGAWYGRRTTSGAQFGAEHVVNIVDSNFIDAEGVGSHRPLGRRRSERGSVPIYASTPATLRVGHSEG